MIQLVLFSVIEGFINPLLQIHPARFQFEKHAGKVLSLQLTNVNWQVFIKFSGEKIKISRLFDGRIDACIKGSSFDFMKQKLTPSVKAQGLVITGDVELAEFFSELSQLSQIDWEELLAIIMGDIPAHQLFRVITKILAKQRTSLESLKNTIADYLQEEKNFLPTAEEVEDFYEDIFLVDQDIERLKLKFRRIREKKKNL